MRPPNDQFSIRNPEKPKLEPKVKSERTFKRWDLCVRRISVFTEVDLDTRFKVCLAFRAFMKKYNGKNKPPFTKGQEAEIRRVLKNGIVTP